MVPDVNGDFPPFVAPKKAQWEIDEENAAKEEARRLAARDGEPPAYSHIPSDRPGRFTGTDATPTETASGAAVEKRDERPLRRNGSAHALLSAFIDEQERTSYEGSWNAGVDGKRSHHQYRREIGRLVDRGFIREVGEMPNPAVNGRPRVKSYIITAKGLAEYKRMGEFQKPVYA